MSLIEQCRGIEPDSFELNASFVIVKAPIQAVASAFTQMRRAKVWQQDVYDREIEIVGQDFIVFQFPSHEWTLIYSLRGGPTEQDAEALAKSLNTESIYYLHSDTGCYTMYRAYDSTGMFESLSSERDTMPYQFQSKRRQLSMEEIGHPAMFTNTFMKEQGVYIPALFVPTVAVGQRLVLKIEAHLDDSTSNYPITLDRSDFQRLDHIGIGRS